MVPDLSNIADPGLRAAVERLWQQYEARHASDPERPTPESPPAQLHRQIGHLRLVVDNTRSPQT